MLTGEDTVTAPPDCAMEMVAGTVSGALKLTLSLLLICHWPAPVNVVPLLRLTVAVKPGLVLKVVPAAISMVPVLVNVVLK